MPTPQLLRTHRSRGSRRAAARAVLLVAASLLITAFAPARTAEADERRLRPLPAAPSPVYATPELEAEWRDYASELRAKARAARARFEAAERAYIKGRHRRRMRGDVRVQAVEERENARRAMERAEAELDALPEVARRAGVPPGWIRSDG